MRSSKAIRTPRRLHDATHTERLRRAFHLATGGNLMPWRKQPAWQRRALEQTYADRTRQEVERDNALVAALNAIVKELDSDRKQRGAADAKRERREKWTVRGLFLTAAITLGGLAASIYQVRLTRTSLDDARENFTQQTSNTRKSLAL